MHCIHPSILKVDFPIQDAEDALYHFNGKNFMGQKYTHIPSRLWLTESKFQFYSIVVEFAKESRPRRDAYDDRHGYSQIFKREISRDMLMEF